MLVTIMKRRPVVFISHCSDDNPTLAPILRYLLGKGFCIWIDKVASFDFSPAEMQWVDYIRANDDDWRRGIYRGLRSADVVLVCWSRAAIDEEKRREVFWEEINFANASEKLLACQIEDLDEHAINKKYRQVQWEDLSTSLTPGRMAAALERIAEALHAKAARTRAGDKREWIPFDANKKPDEIPGFTARAAQLGAVDAHLAAEDDGERTPAVAVCGMPGLGKTSVALAYAHRFAHRYAGILWFNAEERADLVQQIAAIGKAMKPPVEIAKITEEDPGDEIYAKATLWRLDVSDEPILYVFDNVEQPDKIAGLLPRSRRARILITSKFPDWEDQALQIILPLFTLQESRDFLLARVGKQADPVAAATVARLLGGLPLALDHAATYCKMVSFESFLDQYRLYLAEAPPWRRKASKSVFASMNVVLDLATRECPAARDLLEFLSFCAADRIPDTLYAGALANPIAAAHAIAALANVSLIKPDPDRRSVSLHRLVQDAARANAEAQDEGKRAADTFARVARQLSKIHPKSVTTRNWSECSTLTPHLLSLIEHIREEWLEAADDKMLRDNLAKLIVLAILYAPEEVDSSETTLVAPERFIDALAMFYEIEPLAGALRKLVEARSDRWPELRDQFLRKNNYVLRHALAQALGGAIIRGKMPIERATELVDADVAIDRFELGGYALNLVYATERDRIEARYLTELAQHPCYPGRSILGDLMLNLVFDDDSRPLPDFAGSANFWDSWWDYIRLDADAVRAATAFLADPQQPPAADAPDGVRADYAFFAEADGWRRTLLANDPSPKIRTLLQDYHILGREPDSLRAAEAALARSDDLPALMRLLFAHPQWSVAEAAATVLARIAGLRLKNEDDPDDSAARIITDLFESPHWRVRFGAAEAAYSLRQDDERSAFDLAVRRFHADPNCKIRGLCAENLGDIILSASRDERERLLDRYRAEIAVWLLDEDCWVLEHIHRLFGELRTKTSPMAARLLEGPVSPLLATMPNWPATNRTRFLRTIDQAKRERRKAAPV